MEENSITQYYQRKTEKLFRCLQQTKENPCHKNIHSLRLRVKWHKSSVYLLNSNPELSFNFDELLQVLLPVYNSAGEFRENYNNQKLIQSLDSENSTSCLESLRSDAITYEENFTKALSALNTNELHAAFRPVLDQLKQIEYDDLVDSLWSGTLSLLHTINEACCPDMDNVKLHKLRKQIKHLNFGCKWLNNSHVFCTEINLSAFKYLAQQIGKWHDHVVLYDYLNNTESNYKQLINAIKREMAICHNNIILNISQVQIKEDLLEQYSPFHYFKTRDDFRHWLSLNHQYCQRMRMAFYKKHTGVETISYNDAVEEAICFGWIDSLVKGVNNDYYTRKFTPRNKKSMWSATNVQRVENLLKQGLIKEAGIKSLPLDKQNKRPDWSQVKVYGNEKETATLPAYMASAFKANEPAMTNFRNLAASYKRQYINWITDAKTKVTKQKRIDKAIVLLKENKKLGMG